MSTLFQGISGKNKERLLYTLESHAFTFPKNTSIMTVIKDDNIIGFVEYGYMQIIRLDASGTTTIIEELTEQAVFGTLLSSLNNSEYDIIAKEETKIVIINYDKIIKEENPSITYNRFIKNLWEIATNKINEKNERIEILTKKTIRDKLLEYFKIVSLKNGSKIIYLPFSFTDLASYLAVDRSAMSRELKNLKEEGFIKTDNKKITLLY